MYRQRKVSAIVVAAGSSTRMGFDKLLVKLGGVEVLRHSVARLDTHPYVDSIVVVAGDNLPAVEALFRDNPPAKPLTVVPGGATRADSVASGVIACGDASLVAIHDGARPFVTPEIISQAIEAAAETGAAAPAVPVKDTIKLARRGVVMETLPRDRLRAVQTPQVFDRAAFARALSAIPADQRAEYTDDCMVMERAGVPVRLVSGDERNLKITTPEDLARIEALLRPPAYNPSAQTPPSYTPFIDTPPAYTPLAYIPSSYATHAPSPQAPPSDLQPAPLPALRIGHGYDVHKLMRGRPLILGGVNIPHHQGLLGHSDADVLLHAVSDALLGAAALGDLGKHFPDSDEAFKDADSGRLLARVGSLLGAKGYSVVNIDATLVCQAPRLAGHISAMRENIAAALGIQEAAVSVKATTEEGLGFTGSGQGIAAHCVVLLSGG